MSRHSICEMPDVAQRFLKRWCEDVHEKDQHNLRDEELETARAWLTRILVDRVALEQHLDWLGKHLGVVMFIPCGNKDKTLTPEETMSAIVEHGLDALPVTEWPALLLNPYGLCALADMLDEEMPEAWEEAMVAVGEALLAEDERRREDVTIPAEMVSQVTGVDEFPQPFELAFMGEGGVKPSGPDAWELLFVDEAAKALQRRMAEHMYGNGEQAFTFVLHRVGRGSEVQAELQVTPPPINEDLAITIRFEKANAVRTFLLEVPPEVKIDPELPVRETTMSEPCEPLPEIAFTFSGQDCEWQDEDFPPVLVFRGWTSTDAFLADSSRSVVERVAVRFCRVPPPAAAPSSTTARVRDRRMDIPVRPQG